MNGKPPLRSQMVTHRDAILLILTPYQLRVLRLMVSGNSQRDIGFQLGADPRAINQQVERARLLLGCANTYQLIAVLTMSGVLDESHQGTVRKSPVGTQANGRTGNSVSVRL